MKRKVVLFMALFAGLVLLCVRYAHQRAPQTTLPTTNVQAAGPTPGAVAVQPEPSHNHGAASSARGPAPLSQEALWDQPVIEPAFAAFKEWTARYRQAGNVAARAALETEGAALAGVRLSAMGQIIQTDPARAVELAVPETLRAALPAMVRALIESRIDATGDYEVLCVLPAPGERGIAPFVRSATVGGVTHQVFTYGRALDYVTRRNMPLHGIAVPVTAAISAPANPVGRRSAYLMAMSPAPEGGDVGFDVPQLPGNVPTAESSYTEGRKRYLLMRVDFPDYIGDVFPTNNAFQHMVDMNGFLAQISYNKHIIAPVGKGSAITPVMRMANVASFYDNKGLSDLYPEARAVAQNVHGYDLADYDFFFVCTGGRPSYGYAGLGYVGGVGYHLANGYFDVRTSAHELGHNLGLGHANWFDTDERSTIGPGSNEEYGDPFDTMGGSGGGSRHFSASFKSRLDWIPASDALTVTSSGIYRLHAHDIVSAPFGLRALRVNRASGDPYWMEFRQLWIANKAMMNGINFRRAAGGSQLLDMTPGSSGGKDDHSLIIGRTFSDPALNVHVTPMRKANTFPESIEVAINFGPYPANQPPVVVAGASPANAAAGQAITFSANATDSNGDLLAYAWDFGDGDYSVDNAAVTSHSFAGAGEYNVTVSVSDMKGGIGRDSILVNVGTPGTFTIGGRVLNHDGQPLTGVRVSVSGSRYAFTETDGSYTISRLAAGGYTVTAIDPVLDAYVFANPFFNNPVTVGPDFATADFIVSTNPPATYTPIIPVNSSWKYLDNGSNQGVGWIVPGFNDSTWANGVGVLGYTDGNDQIDTTISFGPNSGAKYITYYFRKAFNVPSLNPFSSLRLRVRRDDGVVVYLNNSEIFRDNMPDGAPIYTTLANDAIEPSSYLTQALPLTGLLADSNVIAAEIHQAAPTSSDVAFDLALDGVAVANPAAFNVVYISRPGYNQIFTNPAGILLQAFARSTAGTASQVDFYVDGAKIGEDFTAPFSVNWVEPNQGLHTLSVVALFGANSITSAPVPIQVSAPAMLAVEISAPSSGSNFTVPTSVSLGATAVAGPAALSNVRFYANATLVGEDTSPPYSATLVETSPGTQEIIAVATDALGNAVTSAPVNIAFVQPATGMQLISFGDEWKYLDDGSNQGGAWTGRAFDDRLWKAGPGRLGYGGDGATTLVSFGTNSNQRYITTYFRKTFTVSNLAGVAGLRLRLIRDDGAVIFLNGVEVLRNNLPSGLVSWNTLATTTINAPEETTPVEAFLGLDHLLAGTNVIAVEMHQATLNSSDLGFDLALTGLGFTPTSEEIYLTEPANGTHFNAPANVALAAYANPDAAVPLTVSYFANGLSIGAGSTSVPFGLVWSNAPVGELSLVAVAEWSSGQFSTSAPVNIVVGEPAPRIQPAFSTLIASGATWKYWDNAAAVPAGWQQTNFNDSAWPSGAARLGWGFDGEITPLTEGRVTHYFRRSFTFLNPGLFTELLFQLARDDGAVVYLNGVEVFRSNMPGGVITAVTLASTGVNTPDETTFFEQWITTAGSGSASGVNVVAVELHQSGATSSDAGFDLQLTAYGSSAARVYFSTPADGAGFVRGATIPFEAFARGKAGALVTNVTFFANGVELGQQSSAPWRLTWSNAPVGVSILSARSTDNTGASVDSVPIEISVGRDLVTTTLVASNSTWRYLDTGANLGTSWTATNFNDNAWKSGQTRLGYGNDGETLPAVSFGGNASSKFITTYFRRRFVVPAGAVYTNLTFSLVRDDGAVVWLNGRQMYRSNMPDTPITYLTNAFAAVSGADEQTYFVTATPATNLFVGTNVLAVEIHQSAPDSSDLGFNLHLTASGYEDEMAPPLLALSIEDGFVELRWLATATGWRVYSAPAVNTPGNAWTPVPGTPLVIGSHNVLTTTLESGHRFFRLGKP
jgi:hypothetical protein